MLKVTLGDVVAVYCLIAVGKLMGLEWRDVPMKTTVASMSHIDRGLDVGSVPIHRDSHLLLHWLDVTLLCLWTLRCSGPQLALLTLLC